MNILITICARGGSKGVPGKNIALVNGVPLIAYSIKVAYHFKEAVSLTHQVTIALSTDDQKIIDVASQYKLFSKYKRPPELATDSVGKIAVIKDLLEYQEKMNSDNFDVVLDLDVTAPLRTLEDLISSFSSFINQDEAYNSFSVSPANRNPYFNMIESADGIYAQKSKELSGDIFTRQSAPQVYDLNASFYFYRKIFFQKEFNTVFTSRTMYHIIDHVCFDVDHPIDLEILDFLVSNNKLDFSI